MRLEVHKVSCASFHFLCCCFYRTEFKAYKDVKPTKPIKAPSQYKPPGEETNLETSYSATFKGEQVKAHPADNKVIERRRIRSLYSEPSKGSAKVRASVGQTVAHPPPRCSRVKKSAFLRLELDSVVIVCM